MPRNAITALLPVASLLLLLAGCAPLEPVHTEARKLNAASLDAGKAIRAASTDGAWPDAHWWQALHDAQLDRLVDSALAQQPTLNIALARVRQAEAVAGLSRASTQPRVDAAASASRDRYSANSTVPPPLAGNYAWKASATVNAGYDLDLWGRNRQLLAAALDEVQIASAEAQLARLTLASAIVHNYVQLALQYALHDSAELSLAQRQRLLDISRKRYQAGLASELDVRSMETTLASGRRDIEQLEESMALLRIQLAALSGKGPGDGDTIARPVLSLAAGQGSAVPASLPAELLGHRPDIVAQRWRIEAAGARIGAAQAAFYPNINLSAYAGVQSLGFSHLLDGHSAMAGVMPAISLPLFDAGRLRNQLQEQGALYDVAVEQYNASIVQALSEVANALVRINSVHEQQALAQQAVEVAKRQQQLAEQSYRAGLSDAQTAISAQLTVLNEEQQQAVVASKQLENYTLLMTALGGGIKLELP
ncbi:efflux transporter outer membrane subunit [Duganella qianjiadongensis]|uniref:Efflux transporter outer membrane subunit n=1 Tax=Duganella qianjiadongensis TaxID=2692176 RepID=A0ABW9VL00_9BURK|nr:efflux transporter outer membrane subunit [Duganella qianjiadongensis]MYM40113.1 efflux transporter outer membrane subunit [Duganella qianjiadongensis]